MLRNQAVYHCVRNSQPLVSTLSQINLVHIPLLIPYIFLTRQAMYMRLNTEAHSRIIIAEEKQKVLRICLCGCVRARTCMHTCVGAQARGRVHAHACV